MMVVGIVVRWGCGQGQLRATCFGGHIDAMYRGYTMKEVLSRFLSCWWTYHNVGSFPPMRKTDYSQDVLIANFLRVSCSASQERCTEWWCGHPCKSWWDASYAWASSCSQWDGIVWMHIIFFLQFCSRNLRWRLFCKYLCCGDYHFMVGKGRTSVIQFLCLEIAACWGGVWRKSCSWNWISRTAASTCSTENREG